MPPSVPNVQVPTSRRRFFSGAATVGAAAAVATALPQLAQDSVDTKALPPAPETGAATA